MVGGAAQIFVSISARDTGCDRPIELLPLSHQGCGLGPVVQKSVNANQGLKFNPGSCFSCSKEFSQQITSDRLKTTKVKI